MLFSFPIVAASSCKFLDELQLILLGHQKVLVFLYSSVLLRKYPNSQKFKKYFQPKIDFRLPLVHQNVLVVLYSSIAIFGITANTAILFAFFRNKVDIKDAQCRGRL